MKFRLKIAIVTAALGAVSCGGLSSRQGVGPVARVDRHRLSADEATAALPKGVEGSDSINYVDAFVDRWIVGQLKLHEAERLFSASADDIDRMVEEYRNSLLIRKIEQHCLDTELDTELTDAEVEEYYNAHRDEFRLKSPVVKGCVVAFGDDYRRRERLLQLMRSDREEELRDFEELCLKNRFFFVKFDNWVDFSELAANLPLLRSAERRNDEAMLSKRGVQQIRHDRTYYCFRIFDVLREGDRMPLSMARESIERIIMNGRRMDVLRRYEERILQQALSEGRVEKYYSRPEAELPPAQAAAAGSQAVAGGASQTDSVNHQPL